TARASRLRSSIGSRDGAGRGRRRVRSPTLQNSGVRAMTKRIRITSARPRIVRSTTRTARRIDPLGFGEKLGADPIGFQAASGAPALDALQRTLLLTLRSQGGRPALEGAVRRQKIPMTDADWEALESIAKSFQARGLNATAGQVGGQ